MNKVFLSHSSHDKKYVQYIAEQFGRDHCVYDSMCFEAGMKNIDEIFREMDNTSIFVNRSNPLFAFSLIEATQI